MRATDQRERINIRERRAMGLTSAVLNIVLPHLREAQGREAKWAARHIQEQLMDLFARDGIEILSDHDRQQYGLPPRGPDGWTVNEIIAMEKLKLEIMTKPITFELPSP